MSIEQQPARIIERNATRKVSPEQKDVREERDSEAMRARLRWIKSVDSLRSVDTGTLEVPMMMARQQKRRWSFVMTWTTNLITQSVGEHNGWGRVQ